MNFLRTRSRKLHKGGRSQKEQELIDRLYQNVDHADATLTPQVGNPGFIAQFDIVVIPKYFTVSAGAYTNIAAGSLHASLKTQLTAFLFGNSDKSAGFKKLRSQFPLSGWLYDTPFIYGADTNPAINGVALDATIIAFLQVGDLVIPFYASAGGTDYVGISIIRCSQTGYGSLLDATNSDSFRMNMVRYVMSDTTAASLAQYQNQIVPVNLSLFGKFNADQISPNSFKIPEQQQQNIVDVPINLDIDKQVGLGTYVNYDIPTQMQLSFFVAAVVKVAR